MSRSSDIGVLLTGAALGATAIFFTNEKNRSKAKAALSQLVAETKELGEQWQDDPDKVIAQLKQRAADITQELKKDSKATGKKLSDASKKQMIAALDDTDEKIKAARQSLAAQTVDPAVKETKASKATKVVATTKKLKTAQPKAAQPKNPGVKS